jgi:hypothetical protein
MTGQEGSKPDLGSLIGMVVARLYVALEQFDSKVASGQQNPQVVRASSLLIAKAFTVYGMFKLAYLLVNCPKPLTELMEAYERNLKTISDNLAQDLPDITTIGNELEILSTYEAVLINNLLVCIGSGKQA